MVTSYALKGQILIYKLKLNYLIVYTDIGAVRIMAHSILIFTPLFLILCQWILILIRLLMKTLSAIVQLNHPRDNLLQVSLIRMNFMRNHLLHSVLQQLPSRHKMAMRIITYAILFVFVAAVASDHNDEMASSDASAASAEPVVADMDVLSTPETGNQLLEAGTQRGGRNPTIRAREIRRYCQKLIIMEDKQCCEVRLFLKMNGIGPLTGPGGAQNRKLCRAACTKQRCPKKTHSCNCCCGFRCDGDIYAEYEKKFNEYQDCGAEAQLLQNQTNVQEADAILSLIGEAGSSGDAEASGWNCGWHQRVAMLLYVLDAAKMATMGSVFGQKPPPPSHKKKAQKR